MRVAICCGSISFFCDSYLSLPSLSLSLPLTEPTATTVQSINFSEMSVNVAIQISPITLPLPPPIIDGLTINNVSKNSHRHSEEESENFHISQTDPLSRPIISYFPCALSRYVVS